MCRLPWWSLALVVLFPASLVKAVTAILFAPLWRNKMFSAALSLVVAFDPSMFATLCVIPVIPRRDDITFASRELLVSRCGGLARAASMPLSSQRAIHHDALLVVM
jgi:hypothetical protein